MAGNANVTRYGDAGAPVLAPAPVSTPSSVAAAPVQVPPRPSTEPRTAGPVTPRQLLPFGPDVVTDARPPEVVSSRQREALPSSAEEAAAAPNTATTALSSDQPVFSVPLP
ncbi:MAG: hypothetical protein J0H62_06590 [Rhizobiales bacterium]|nr:hypothetical protein [Hyphomicrobiales bacterium]